MEIEKETLKKEMSDKEREREIRRLKNHVKEKVREYKINIMIEGEICREREREREK